MHWHEGAHDITGARTGQEQRHFGNFFRASVAAQWNGGFAFRLRLFPADAAAFGFQCQRLLDATGQGETRVDAIDADAERRVMRGQSDRGQHQRSIGCAACEMRTGGMFAAGADDIDDGADLFIGRCTLPGACHQPLQHEMLHMDAGIKLGVESLLPQSWRQIFGFMALGRTGAIDQQIDRSQRGLHCMDDFFAAFCIKQIGSYAEYLQTFVGQAADGGIDVVLRTRDDGHLCAFLGEATRHRQADAFAAAGDQRHAAFEFLCHFSDPFFYWSSQTFLSDDSAASGALPSPCTALLYTLKLAFSFSGMTGKSVSARRWNWWNSSTRFFALGS